MMTRERCLIRALFTILAIGAVCLRVPESLGENPFCIICSMNLLSARNLKIDFLRHEVNIFKGTVSKVMGRKLAGSDE